MTVTAPGPGSVAAVPAVLRGLFATACLSVACTSVPSAVGAQTPYTEHTLRARPGDPLARRPKLTLASVRWLVGSWRGEGLGALAEETWMPPAGGAMVGTFRLVDGGEVRFYELVTLVEDGGSLLMRLKHFGPDLVGWEPREAHVEFPLLSTDDDTLWFDGLTVRRVSEDELHVWVALEQQGEVHEALFTYRRAEPVGARTSGNVT